MSDLSDALKMWLNTMFEGRLPDELTTGAGTAFAAAVTFSLAQPIARCPVLCCLPKAEAPQLMNKHGIDFTPPEFMVDFLVVDQESQTRRVPLIACESEMQNQVATYGIGPEYGYVWDFVKLLHFNAPRLLYFACVPSSKKWIPELATSLNRCAGEYRELWSGRRLDVVLLPTTNACPIRLGEGQPSGEIAFRDL